MLKIIVPIKQVVDVSQIKFDDDVVKPHSKFAKVLAKLIGDPAEMIRRYPVHALKQTEDCLHFIPCPKQ